MVGGRQSWHLRLGHVIGEAVAPTGAWAGSRGWLPRLWWLVALDIVAAEFMSRAIVAGVWMGFNRSDGQ